MNHRSAPLVALAFSVSLLACSSGPNGGSGGGGNTTSGPGAGGASGGSGGASNGGAAGGGNDMGGGGSLLGSGGGPGSGGAGGGTGGETYFVYASTDTDLFQLDPTAPNLPLTHIGTFDCIDPVNGPHTAMVDIAVDKDQNLWGITGHDVVPLTVMGQTVHCGAQISLNSKMPGQQVPTFYALTFAPVGVLDPDKEVLVAGNSAGELWMIDAAGAVSKHGFFGTVPADDGNGNTYDAANVGKPWELSGDIVFLANGNKPVGFATVRDCPNPPSTTGCSKIDTLLEIDMTKFSQPNPGAVVKAIRGKVVKAAGCGDAANSGYGSMYGIAAWNATVFGFSRTGNLVSMSDKDGAACLVKNFSGDKFSGAGVTTLAPIEEPPVK
jgi:hypothetical protein